MVRQRLVRKTVCTAAANDYSGYFLNAGESQFYFEWGKNLSHMRFGRLQKHWKKSGIRSWWAQSSE